MEGELESTKMPLLEGWKLTGSGLRHDFLLRLPDKVIKSCVIDSEASSIINYNISGLTKGNLSFIVIVCWGIILLVKYIPEFAIFN